MQNWTLERKIQVSQTRIIEFAQKTNNKIYVLFYFFQIAPILCNLSTDLS